MYIIKQTETFTKWFSKLKDIKGKVAILRRIDRIQYGNFGDSKGIGDNISELRLQIGAGYRVYYTIKGNEVVILLVGGDKSTQTENINKAKQILKDINDGNIDNI